MVSVLALVIVTSLPNMLLAASCGIKAPEIITSIHSAWSAEPFPGNKITPFVTREFNGEQAAANWAHVKMSPNSGVPPHRHSGSEEYVYVTKGQAVFTYWIPGMKDKVSVVMKEGSFHYLPADGIHDVHTAEEGMEFLVSTTPAGFRFEVFDSWPESFDGELKGTFLGLLDSAGCPPGQEPKEEL